MSDNTPSFPGNEAERLNALKSYHILDTLPGKEYDAITRLASYICQTPVALITLIDEDRQWFKSKIGIDIAETPRASAFCSQTILHDEIMEISNTLEDETFKDNIYVKGQAHVRFYAGAPLIDPNGHRLGSLCVVDTVPRKLTAEQRDALGTLASEVMSHLLLEKQKKALEASLEAHKEFYNLFNSSPEIHLITDEDTKISVINNAVTSILGYDPQQLIGRSLWDFVVDKNTGQFTPLVEKSLAAKTSFEMESQTLTSANEVKWISWFATCKAGKWYASGRDITYHKNILAELEQLSLVASKMINGVVISDANDHIIWTNEAFEKITGYSNGEVEKKRLRDVIIDQNDEYNDIAQYNELIKRKESYGVHVYATHKDGQKMWLSLINSVIRDQQGEVTKYIRIISDITARKMTQKDLEILSFASRKSPSGMLIRDAKGTIIWMNEALERIWGYTLAEMKDQSFGTSLFGKETNHEVAQSALNSVGDKRSYDVELKLYRKDNTPVWVSIANNLLLNDAGEVERQIASVIDITKRKADEAELKMLALVASNTTSGVIINDGNGDVEWVNNAFEKITGYNIDDLRHKHLGDVLKGELTDVSIIEQSRELSKNKQSFEVDLLVYRKDGQPIWISVINSVIVNTTGKVEKYIEVIIDISAKKRVELELIAAKEEALQLNRAKDMFISVMSHEIRTPLNAVIAMSHLLLKDAHDEQEENLNILKFSAQNLMGLINDVLDFTKIETGNIELEKTEVNLIELVHDITSSMQYKTAEKNIYLTQIIDQAVPEIVIGDRTRLSQILLNLVSNAVKFTEQGGVTIELKVIEQNESSARIRFAVKDTGIGIANNKLNTIFESFKQAELDTTRKYGGTGLGLAISKRLIELHDSHINVSSVQGAGSDFWFTITFNKSNQLKNDTINLDSTLNITVLVVDDNQINRLLINKILTKWGAKGDFAENGIQAIHKIEGDQKYDAVLMDIHMPEMGGLEATKIIRSKNEAYFKQLPIIALTASVLNSQMNEIGDSGMNDYILKPFEPKVLFEKLSRYQKQ